MTGELRLDHIEHADALAYLKTLSDECVNLCVTSPPYFGLRDYGADGQIGLEDTPAAYIARLVAVFAEVKRVLRTDASLYVNLGDSYATNGGAHVDGSYDGGVGRAMSVGKTRTAPAGLPAKSLMLIPHRFAIAMQDDGWLLREDIVWQKPNPMPESVRDRCTRSHEYIFHFTKGPRYWYDQQVVAEKAVSVGGGDFSRDTAGAQPKHGGESRTGKWAQNGNGRSALQTRNRRSVWTINPASYREAHFATFPEDIPEIIIQAACPEGGVVLDPFMGAGTTALVAKRLNRRYLGCDLNPEYVEMARRRVDGIPYTLFSLMEATGD